MQRLIAFITDAAMFGLRLTAQELSEHGVPLADDNYLDRRSR